MSRGHRLKSDTLLIALISEKSNIFIHYAGKENG